MQFFLSFLGVLNRVFVRLMFWNWPRPVKIQWMVIIGGLLALFLFVLGDKGVSDLIRLKQEVAKVKKVVVAMQQSQQEYQIQIWGLKNQNNFIENSARQNLGMIAPNERVLEITKIKP